MIVIGIQSALQRYWMIIDDNGQHIAVNINGHEYHRLKLRGCKEVPYTG